MNEQEREGEGREEGREREGEGREGGRERERERKGKDDDGIIITIKIYNTYTANVRRLFHSRCFFMLPLTSSIKPTSPGSPGMGVSLLPVGEQKC